MKHVKMNQQFSKQFSNENAEANVKLFEHMQAVDTYINGLNIFH
jgi:hypothetical protein